MSIEDQRVSVVDVAAEALFTPEEVMPPPPERIRELRMALVCYGGVSLAIYMHGITKEIHKAVAASTAYERNHESNPFAPDDSASSYWDVLKEQHDRTGVRTRLVVDIVSGTSAGGINGVFLAAALARNRSQDGLRRLWMDKGDIKKLLAGPRWLPAFVKAPLFLYRSVRNPLRIKPPLRGDDICHWLNEAFDEMDKEKPETLSDLPSLIPERQRLQLFVPITDFFGYDVRIPLDDPKWVRDRTHRHCMRFVHDGQDWQQLSAAWNDVLALAARGTSSFPGAFPPISIPDYEQYVGHKLDRELQETMFPAYFLADAEPDRTHFIDGGVLDNKPFGTTIDAIKLRPAASEVDRRLAYVEPDPSTESGGLPAGAKPGWFGTVFGGYAGIPRKEPILDDLADLAQHNANVGRIRDIIETAFDPIRTRALDQTGSKTGTVPDNITATKLRAWRAELGTRAIEESGFAYPTYLRLRIRAVVDDFARLVAERNKYPSASTHALFVGRVLREWAGGQDLFAQAPTATDAQHAFLAALDLGYHDRHLRFLIAALNWWYSPDVEAERVPRREQLDASKHQLYRHLDELQRIAASLTEDRTVADSVRTVFSKPGIDAAVDLGETPQTVVDRHRSTLQDLDTRVRELVGERLRTLSETLDDDLIAITEAWTPWARTEILVRHLGFAFWDALVYPVEFLSGVNERDHVEVMRLSPHEAVSLVEDASAKDLKGKSLGHFGAFFSREGRENDYLWGRLDGADRVIALLQTGPGESVQKPSPEACKPAFKAILNSERSALTKIRDVFNRLDLLVDESSRRE